MATTYQPFPLVTPILRLLTNRYTPFVALTLVVVVALVAAIASFGLVVLTLTATALVPVVAFLLIGVSLP